MNEFYIPNPIIPTPNPSKPTHLTPQIASHLQNENLGLHKFSVYVWRSLNWLPCPYILSFVAMSSSSQAPVICLFVCWCTSQKVKSSISTQGMKFFFFFFFDKKTWTIHSYERDTSVRANKTTGRKQTNHAPPSPMNPRAHLNSCACILQFWGFFPWALATLFKGVLVGS